MLNTCNSNFLLITTHISIFGIGIIITKQGDHNILGSKEIYTTNSHSTAYINVLFEYSFLYFNWSRQSRGDDGEITWLTMDAEGKATFNPAAHSATLYIRVT